MDLLIDLTDNDFQGFIMETSNPIIVCFWCHRVPEYQKLRKKMQDLAYKQFKKIWVVCVNVDENPNTTLRLDIKGVPSFKFFLEGKEVSVLPGLVL